MSGTAQRRNNLDVLAIALLLVGLGLKLLLEAPWRAPLQTVPGWDFPVAPLAHATGALAGLACAALADALSSSRRERA